jgi:ferredoxin
VFNPKRGRIIVDLEEPDIHHIRLCIQCGRCADACPVDAIYQDFTILTTSEQGIYRLDPDKCIGCGDCLDVCPTRVLEFYPDLRMPRKCDFCHGQPQCVKYCPTHALGWVLG